MASDALYKSSHRLKKMHGGRRLSQPLVHALSIASNNNAMQTANNM